MYSANELEVFLNNSALQAVKRPQCRVGTISAGLGTEYFVVILKYFHLLISNHFWFPFIMLISYLFEGMKEYKNCVPDGYAVVIWDLHLGTLRRQRNYSMVTAPVSAEVLLTQPVHFLSPEVRGGNATCTGRDGWESKLIKTLILNMKH